jgi:hypothetical protein
MQSIKHVVWGCLFMASLFVGCSSQEESETTTDDQLNEKWEPQMYNVSELVKVMRSIEEDLKVQRDTLQKGGLLAERPTFYENIKTAEATDPEEITAVYMALADKFLADYDSVHQADAGVQVEKFNGMINTCVACHEQYCQGPIPKIKKLLITE